MDLRRLRTVLAVMEHGSLSRAAERLGVAQPALGAQLRHLEEELGVPLFHRHSRGITPTEAGRALRDGAQPLLEGLDALAARIRDLGNAPRGRVVVGVTPSTGNLLAAPLLRATTRDLPGVTLSFVEALSTALIDRVAEGTVDLAVCYDMPSDRRGVRGETLAQDWLVFVEAREAGRIAGRAEIPFAEAAAVPLVMSALGNEVLRRKIEESARAAGLDVIVAHEVQSMGLTRALLSDPGLGAILPYGALIDDIHAGRLVAARLVRPVVERRLCLVHSDRRPLNRAELALRSALLQLIAAPDGDGWQAPPGREAL
ncbi:LysR family transcriptional regulator, nitrogen assimilation regulatory protein [Roseomonas rosea]|uniref:LysR family transcriptional regulator, nitrogen assimilation regulatory protein n=1 Tax=Muricoccus roseus TaxID=198092 RepID=A0A1M6HK26_9PROT|nr:LysR substrate-binding domain-containing protein [Roseomonas rosea]SHJ22544.1 LysR family transcriptional regulator, nitrogen assimilation regulatory protein [Roseomonas rosea]